MKKGLVLVLFLKRKIQQQKKLQYARKIFRVFCDKLPDTKYL